MPNYPLYHTISKNTHLETEKENFFLFCIFLETSFLGIKKKFSPPFLRHFKSDRAENFFGETSSDLG